MKEFIDDIEYILEINNIKYTKYIANKTVIDSYKGHKLEIEQSITRLIIGNKYINIYSLREEINTTDFGVFVQKERGASSEVIGKGPVSMEHDEYIEYFKETLVNELK